MKWLTVLFALAGLAGHVSAPHRALDHRSGTLYAHRYAPLRHAASPSPIARLPGAVPSATPIAGATPTATATATPAPTPTATPYPSVTSVTLDDSGDPYTMHATTRTLAPGKITFYGRNIGMDEHNLTVQSTSTGDDIDSLDLPPDPDPDPQPSLTVKLAPGTYKLYCTLFNHDQLGMHTTITVK